MVQPLLRLLQSPEYREIGNTQATNHQLRCKSGCFFYGPEKGKKIHRRKNDAL